MSSGTQSHQGPRTVLPGTGLSPFGPVLPAAETPECSVAWWKDWEGGKGALARLDLLPSKRSTG